jgi:hypothetical protein
VTFKVKSLLATVGSLRRVRVVLRQSNEVFVKVYDRVDSAEVREDGTYDNSVFSVPEEGTASQLDAPVQPAPAPAPATSTADTNSRTDEGNSRG